MGEPHLGAAALICFEWLQRPENVLTGKITWPDYRSGEHPNHVRIFHHKTDEVVLQPGRNFVEANETATRVDLEGDMESRLGTKRSEKTV
jgi:hypothetical protein